MMNEHADKQNQYDIKIEGHLDGRWQDWFEGFTITRSTDGHTILSGSIHNQAATVWLAIEAVFTGLGGGVEVVGGMSFVIHFYDKCHLC